MKVVLTIILVLTLVQAGMIDAQADTILQQIYGVLFYIMALMAFCTLAILCPVKKSCWFENWNKKDRRRHEKDHRAFAAIDGDDDELPEEYRELKQLADDDEEDDFEEGENDRPPFPPHHKPHPRPDMRPRPHPHKVKIRNK